MNATAFCACSTGVAASRRAAKGPWRRCSASRILEDFISDNPGRRAAALAALVDIAGDQKAMLLEMLSMQVARHPDHKLGYDAFRALVERGIPGAAATLGEVGMSVPPGRIPPAVGLDLRTLLKARPEVASHLQQVLDTGAETPTQVGRALKSRPVR